MSKATTGVELLFTGKDNCMTFDKFDDKVISWGRLKYGEKYAKALWRNELVDLLSLDLTDDLDKYKFEEHCSFVNDVISCDKLSRHAGISCVFEKPARVASWI